MPELIDRIHFQELSQRDPKEICRRASCKYDAMNEMYILSIWGDDYNIFPRQLKIENIGNHTESPHDYFKLIAIHYLLNAKDIPISNKWISEKDIPGGELAATPPMVGLAMME